MPRLNALRFLEWSEVSDGSELVEPVLEAYDVFEYHGSLSW